VLRLPTVGMRRSVEKHNIDLNAVCDWIEGNVLFESETISIEDVVDQLIDNEVYDEQDFARERLSDAWDELERREHWMGNGTSIKIVGQRVIPYRAWQDNPAYSFCLALAYARWYPDWAAQFGSNYTIQGVLFEELTKASLEVMFPQWIIHRTGWSQSNAVTISDVVEDVATRLSEEIGEVEAWTSEKAKEAGLDLLCYRSYEDGRVGVPVYLLQCASGKDWTNKLHTPDLKIWKRVVRFVAEPRKAFAMPFAVDNEEFVRRCNVVDGPFIDRYRLLAAGRDDPDWVPADLRERIVRWLEPRLAQLPQI